MQQLPRDVWRYRVRRLDVADLSDARRLARVKLTVPSPGRRAWPPYQNVGEGLWKEGWRGLLAVSAARPTGRVLCLFLDQADAQSVETVEPPTVVVEPPVPPTRMRT